MRRRRRRRTLFYLGLVAAVCLAVSGSLAVVRHYASERLAASRSGTRRPTTLEEMLQEQARQEEVRRAIRAGAQP